MCIRHIHCAGWLKKIALYCSLQLISPTHIANFTCYILPLDCMLLIVVAVLRILCEAKFPLYHFTFDLSRATQQPRNSVSRTILQLLRRQQHQLPNDDFWTLTATMTLKHNQQYGNPRRHILRPSLTLITPGCPTTISARIGSDMSAFTLTR
jgi:hypothetical protein